MRASLRVGITVAIAVAAFVGGYKLRPKLTPEAVSAAYAKYVQRQPSHKQELKGGTIDTVMATDFRAVIGIATSADAAARRAAMAAYAFRGDAAGLARRPDRVERDVTTPWFAGMKVAGIDVLTVNLPWQVDSKIYHLRAAKPASCLMIFQEGHRVSFLERVRYLESLTEAGCDVLALSLPLTGPVNARPVIDHPRLGRVVLNDPDDLQLLDSRDYSAMAYFMLPLAAALNHALDQQPYARVGATGFSGGGWAVQVFAAMDPRVQATYSVAGSSPEAVHAAIPTWGSPEQRDGRFYEIANHPEIYVLDADRAGRRHVQFFNDTDPCCFSGRNWQAWQQPVAERVRQLGGDFRVFSYVSAEHTLTEPVEQTIVADFMGGLRDIPAGVTAH